MCCVVHTVVTGATSGIGKAYAYEVSLNVKYKCPF